MSDKTVVYFDGMCGLCNRAVDFLLSRDRSHRLLFSPLQGETAIKFLSLTDREDLNSIVVTRGTQVYRRSTAIIEAAKELGGLYLRLALLAERLPSRFRDAIYDGVAENRYKIFGKRDTCRLPLPNERAQFLP